MNNSLDDWLEWADARGGTLEEAGFREWLSELIRKEREDAWVEGVYDFEEAHKQDNLEPWGYLPENPYRKE